MTVTRHRPEPATGALPRSADRSVAGLLLLSAGSAVVLGIMTAEALYPAAYNVHRNTVSDLAAMRPEDIVRQPSAAIFNTTMIVAGALIAVAAVLLYRSRAGLLATLPVAGLGVGMIGVGIFPGNTVMAVVALPMVAAGDVDEAMQQVIVNCLVVVIVFAVVPWGYVWQRYVVAKGDRWR